MAHIKCEIFSSMLSMQTTVNAIIPDAIKDSEQDVIYLLHGIAGNSSVWERYSAIERYANEHNVAVIMPESNRSFYADIKFGVKYFSYIADELPLIMNKLFNLSLERNHNMMAGLSMGGYGALKVAFTYPNRYKAVASFSCAGDIEDVVNGVHFKHITNELKAIFGTDLAIKDDDNIFSLLENANKNKDKPFVYMACGTEDYLYEHSKKIREYINSLNFDFKYDEWSGAHNWDFWDKAIQSFLSNISEKL